MGHDDVKRPVQPAGTHDRRGTARLVATSASHQSTSQTFMSTNDVFLTGTGQQISHRSFQNAAPGHNQKHVVRQALSSYDRWTEHSENNLPIPASNSGPTMSEQQLLYAQTLSDSVSLNTLPVTSTPHSAMPQTTSVTVLESPMVPFAPTFEGVIPGVTDGMLQQVQSPQFEPKSVTSEPASLEQLMNEDDEMYEFDGNDAMALEMNAGSSVPQFNECPTGQGNGSSNGAGGSHAESGSGGQGHCVTGYSHQNYGSSMVTGGGGGLGGNGNNGDDDDPFQNNRPLQRDHYSNANIFLSPEDEDILRIIGEQNLFEEIGGQNPFLPTLGTNEMLSEMDQLPTGILAGTPGDNMMGYYAKFESQGDGGLQPMEESAPISAAPSGTLSPVPQQQAPPPPVPPAPVTTGNNKLIANSFDMIKMMNKKKTAPPPPVLNDRPTELSLPPPPPSPAGSYMSAPSPAVRPPVTPSTPQLSHPVQVSTPQRQEQEGGTFSAAIQQQLQPPPQRAPSMPPPPSPAAPPTPVNVRPFDCGVSKEGGKINLEMVVRKDLPNEDRKLAIMAFYSSVQFSMDLHQLMKNPCDLKVSYHFCANICEYQFDSEENKLVFSVPADCKHVSEWLSEKGNSASFLDRHAVLQQVLNTMATVHNGGRDKSLWGCFQVFVAPDSRVYIVPDIVPMLSKMQATVGDPVFNPRLHDIQAICELYKMLIPSTINQGRSWISPGVSQLLRSFEHLVSLPSSIFKMAEIARTLGEKNMCRMDVDYLGMDKVNVFCVEHELVLTALTAIQNMIPEGTTIVWLPKLQPVAIHDLATAIRPMSLCVTYSSGY